MANAIEKAVATYQVAEAKLFRDTPRGRMQFFTNDEHDRRLREATDQLEATLAQVIADSEAAIAEAQQVTRPRPDDPAWLSADELAKANAAAAFVREDLEVLSPVELTNRLSEVAAGEDRVSKWLHVRYGARQWQTHQEALGRQSLDDPAYLELQRNVFAVTGQYNKTLQEMSAAVIPEEVANAGADVAKRHAAAATTIHEAKMASPSHRVEFAARFGVPAEHLPAVGGESE